MSENSVKKEVLNRLFFEIRGIEGQNLKTGKLTDDDMRRNIMKKIKEAVTKEEKNEI